MLVVVFLLPLITALLCVALNQLVATRYLGFGAALALALALVVLLVGRAGAAFPLVLPSYAWAVLGDATIELTLRFDGASWPLVVLILAGGACAVLALALAVPGHLRGFGGLFTGVLLVLLAVVVGLANEEPLLLPGIWAVIVLLGFVVLRSSGTQARGDAMPVGLVTGLLGALVLLGAVLAAPVGLIGVPKPPLVLVCWVLAGLLALGGPPFHAALDELTNAPAALVGVLVALGLPLLGGYALLRFTADQAVLPPVWRNGMTLVGAMTLLASAGGAVNTTRLRQLLGWQFSAQVGLLLMALAYRGVALTVGGPALLGNMVLTTLAGALAVAVLERRAGTDDLMAIGAHGPLVLPGMAFSIAAASAMGFPGTLGFWARWWLLGDVLRQTPWVVPLVLTGSALVALSFAAPLAAFWRVSQSSRGGERVLGGYSWFLAELCPVLVALPLVVMGAMPQVAWGWWLASSQEVLAPAVAGVPVLPGGVAQFAALVAAVGMVALPLVVRWLPQRAAERDADMRNDGLLTPHGLGQSLSWVAWVATFGGVFSLVWGGMVRLGGRVRRLLDVFEGRYYLAGLVIALIVTILLLL